MSAHREQIERIYREAVTAVDPRARVRETLHLDDSGETLAVAGVPIALDGHGVRLIAIGKAGAAMASGALDALGELVRGGVVVTKEPADVGHEAIEVMQGAHPVPDERSLAAGRAVLDFAAQVPENGVVLCLISGGGSALVESLREGVSLEELQSVTKRLLEAGASIGELNAVRSRMSRIKGGGLLAALRHARVVNLIISDVLGDDLQTIASGPSVPRAEDLPAEDVLARYGIDTRLPGGVDGGGGEPLVTEIVANLDSAIDAAAVAAQRLGLRPAVVTNRLEGEARMGGRLIASMLANHARPFSAFPPGTCLLGGGEMTVTVRGDGEGGRNTEAALAAAIALSGTSGLTAAFLATDGDDGTTGAAGAIVDGATIQQSELRRAAEALARNDSFGFLSGTGAVWSPGPTGTNVNDLVIGIVE